MFPFCYWVSWLSSREAQESSHCNLIHVYSLILSDKIKSGPLAHCPFPTALLSQDLSPWIHLLLGSSFSADSQDLEKASRCKDWGPPVSRTRWDYWLHGRVKSAIPGSYSSFTIPVGFSYKLSLRGLFSLPFPSVLSQASGFVCIRKIHTAKAKLRLLFAVNTVFIQVPAAPPWQARPSLVAWASLWALGTGRIASRGWANRREAAFNTICHFYRGQWDKPIC